MNKIPAFKISVLVAFLIAASVGMARFYVLDFSEMSNPSWGVTFSQKFAQELNLDWQETYLAILDDLQVDNLRLVAYWDLVEPIAGEFDFSDLDWQIEQAGERGVTVFLAIGQRVPRWPECHIPDWADGLSNEQRKQSVLNLIQTTVNHFKNQEAIVAWQVENEPLLNIFGQCPKSSVEYLKKEAETARQADPTRPIIITDSGELSFWMRVPRAADILGISVYRVAWNKYVGYVQYPYPAAYYQYKSRLVRSLFGLDDVIITELQQEAWGIDGKSLPDIEISEQLRFMNAERFAASIQFARKAGFSQVYLWGAEWWYWLKLQGEESLWQAAQDVWR